MKDPTARTDDLVDLARRRFPLREVVSLIESVEQLVARASGLGRIEELLDAPGIDEVMVNGPGPVWIERDGGLEITGLVLDEADIEVLVERMLHPLGLRVDPLHPCVDARLADGSRVNVVVPPVAVDGVAITVRRFAANRLPFDAFGPVAMSELLTSLVGSRATVLVVGGTGAGKTTLLNTLGSAIPEPTRIVTVEDTAELRLPGRHVIRLEARPANREGLGEVTIRQLVRNALRMRPDRLIIGEVRGGEALDLLLALNTGHAGSLTTCHADDATTGLRRLETLAMLGGVDLPLKAVRRQILSAIDVVVHVERRDGERRVASISEVDPERLLLRQLWPTRTHKPVRAPVRRALKGWP
jgi:pilus assembly protein CpaF